MIKSYLNCSVLNRRMGWKPGQKCLANVQPLNRNTQSIDESGLLFILLIAYIPKPSIWVLHAG